LEFIDLKYLREANESLSVGLACRVQIFLAKELRVNFELANFIILFIIRKVF
jgi:hypothetical protein